MVHHLPPRLRPFLSTLFLYPLTAAVISLLPLLLWQWNPVFIRSTYGEAYQPFELFGFWGAAAVLGRTLWLLWTVKPLTWPRVLPILVPAAILLHFLGLISEYSTPAWDYNCYQSAAAAILAQSSPYSGCYLYPPLLAEILAAFHTLLLKITFISRGEADRSWAIVFYLFQCAQFFSLALAYPLIYRFARRLGFEKTTAVLLTAALLLINNPLLRTLRHTQVNLFVLDLFLLALLLAGRVPLLSGFSAAVGINLKLYPAVLFIPWLLTRRWRPILFALIGLALIILLSAEWGQEWSLWEQFLSASQSFPPGTQFRDNSLHSLVFNGLGFFAGPMGMAAETFRAIVSIIVAALSLLLAGWLGLRIFRRQQSLKTAAAPIPASAELHYFSQAMDSLALGLLLAPRVWEHHYVLAVPIVLWGMAISGRERPLLVGTAAILMLALPTFDIYPLSYHRLAGLLLMLYLTSPRETSRRLDTGGIVD